MYTKLCAISLNLLTGCHLYISTCICFVAGLTWDRAEIDAYYSSALNIPDYPTLRSNFLRLSFFHRSTLLFSRENCKYILIETMAMDFLKLLPSMDYPPAQEGRWSPVTSTLNWCEEVQIRIRMNHVY